MVKIFLPSLLGAGVVKRMGPDVSGTASAIDCCADRDPSRMAHIPVTPLRVAWKTKYFPSAVQFRL